MNKSRFLTMSFFMIVIFLFLKIYQHNKIVTLMYKKQRIERMRDNLKKQKDALLVDLYRAKDLRLIRKNASETLSMWPLEPSHIQTITFLDNVQQFTVRS